MSLTLEQLDIFQEMINIGVGRAANLLNSLSGKHVALAVPSIKVLKYQELIIELDSIGTKDDLSCVILMFSGEISGSSCLIFSTEQASKLVLAFTGTQTLDLDFDEIQAETLSEIGNIVLNSLVGSIANNFGISLNYSIPMYLHGNLYQVLSSELSSNQNGLILYARTHFKVESLEIEGDFLFFCKLESIPFIIQTLNKINEKGGFLD